MMLFMEDKELILIKFGGSIITDKNIPFTARRKVIAGLGKEIFRAKNKVKVDIITGNGSGSFGHTVASKYNTQDGIINKKSIIGLSLVSDAAVQINRIVIDELIKVGLPVVSFSPSSFLHTSGKKLKSSYIKPIIRALGIGIIPVIYGDIIFDEKKGCCIYSGEKTLIILAAKLKPLYKKVRIIYCGDTRGVYDADGKTISIIDSKLFIKLKKQIGGSRSIDVTGGMLHKVSESLKIANKYGMQTTILNGTEHGNLLDSILDKRVVSTLVGS